MKKLLVVLLAAMMVLSIAAVSMAAATVEGDFRAEWTKEDGTANEDIKFGKSDLRLKFKGNVSDTVDAYMIIANEKGAFKHKEYAVTLNQDWGKVQAGNWDYKLIPSRVLAKPHGVNCVNAGGSGMQWAFDIPVGDGANFGLWLIPDLSEDVMDYDVKFGYKGDGFGAEIHYGVVNDPALALANLDANYYSFDFYYNVADNIKAFIYGINFNDEMNAWQTVSSKKALFWDEDLAPVIGATFSNIGGSKLTASLEYGLVDAIDFSNGDKFAQMALQLKYSFTNKVALEVEYYNYNTAKVLDIDADGKDDDGIVNENKT